MQYIIELYIIQHTPPNDSIYQSNTITIYRVVGDDQNTNFKIRITVQSIYKHQLVCDLYPITDITDISSPRVSTHVQITTIAQETEVNRRGRKGKLERKPNSP